MGESQAQGHFSMTTGIATLAFQPQVQRIQRSGLPMSFRQLLNNGNLFIQVVSSIKRPPEKFNGLGGLLVLNWNRRQPAESRKVTGVGSQRAAHNLNALQGLAEANAHLREEVADVRVAGRRGNQFATRL